MAFLEDSTAPRPPILGGEGGGRSGWVGPRVEHRGSGLFGPSGRAIERIGRPSLVVAVVRGIRSEGRGGASRSGPLVKPKVICALEALVRASGQALRFPSGRTEEKPTSLQKRTLALPEADYAGSHSTSRSAITLRPVRLRLERGPGARGRPRAVPTPSGRWQGRPRASPCPNGRRSLGGRPCRR
jgi:hypothetical protein